MTSSENQPPAVMQPAKLGVVFYFGLSIALVAYAVVALVIGALAAYAMPSADDFCYAHKAVRHGLIGASIDEYYSWSGRYSATFVMSVITTKLDFIRQYWVLSVLVVVSLGGGIFLFLWSLLGRVLMAALLCGPVLIFAIIGMPKPGEALFWLAGGATYGVSAGLLLAWLAGMLVLVRTREAMGVSKMLLAVCLTVLAAILAGFQESLMLMIIALAGLFTLASLVTPRRWSVRGALLVITIVALAAGIVVALNPGAGARASTHALANNLMVTPIAQLLLVVVTIVLTVPGQLGGWASALSATSLTSGQGSIRLSQKMPLGIMAWIVVGSVLVLAAGGLAPAWGMGAPPSPRAFTPLYVFCFAVVLTLLLGVTPHLQDQVAKLGWGPKTRGRLLGVIWALHGLAILGGDFVGEGVTNLTIGGNTPAADFKKQWLERYDQVEVARQSGDEQLILAPLAERPSLLFISDIVRDSWMANCFSDYMGMEDIHAADGG